MFYLYDQLTYYILFCIIFTVFYFMAERAKTFALHFLANVTQQYNTNIQNFKNLSVLRRRDQAIKSPSGIHININAYKQTEYFLLLFITFVYFYKQGNTILFINKVIVCIHIILSLCNLFLASSYKRIIWTELLKIHF